MVTESEMKELYRKGVKGKADRWESGLIAKTPLTSVSSEMKGLYADFTKRPPTDKWYSKWFAALSG